MKLLKTYLKPFAALVLACILLLFGQAMCDLTLPNVMSDIVNTGIRLGGVDEAAPAVLNQQAVDLLTLFMNDAEAGTFKNAYTPVEHGSDEETKLAKTYENIKDIDAVALSEDADVQAVGDAYGKAAYAFMTFLKDYGAQTGQAVDTESGVQDTGYASALCCYPHVTADAERDVQRSDRFCRKRAVDDRLAGGRNVYKAVL